MVVLLYPIKCGHVGWAQGGNLTLLECCTQVSGMQFMSTLHLKLHVSHSLHVGIS